MHSYLCHERKVIKRVQGGELVVDGFGRVWKIRRQSGRPDGSSVATYYKDPKRAERKSGGGYLQVAATVNGRRYYASAHRLVWQHFFGDIPDGMQINHKNGIKDDNMPGNLEIVTPSENNKHAIRTGLVSMPKGHECSWSKLTPTEVNAIRKLYGMGKCSQEDIAFAFEVNQGTVRDIINHKNWKVVA